MIPLNVRGFIKGFRDQSDFVKESNNLLRMTECHRGNSVVKIPRLMKISESIIIMEYLEGVAFEDIHDKSGYLKSKIFTYFYLFTRESMIYHNFNHGDLHQSNWFIQEDPESPMKYKIAIVDFGFCWSTSHSKMKILSKAIDMFEAVDTTAHNDEDILTLSDIFYNCVDHSHIIDKDSFHQHIIKFIKESPNIGKNPRGVRVTPTSIYRTISEFSYQHGVLIDHELMNFMILYSQIQKTCAMYGFSSITGYDQGKRVYKERYVHCLNVCKTYKIFQNYQNYIEDKLNELQVDRSDKLFDYIDLPDSLQQLALS